MPEVNARFYKCSLCKEINKINTFKVVQGVNGGSNGILH